MFHIYKYLTQHFVYYYLKLYETLLKYTNTISRVSVTAVFGSIKLLGNKLYVLGLSLGSWILSQHKALMVINGAV